MVEKKPIPFVETKGLNISSSEARALQGASPAQIEQATRLLRTGRAGAARGDVQLSPIVNALSALGIGSFAAQRIQAQVIERARQEKIRTKEIEAEKLKARVPTPAIKSISLPSDVKKTLTPTQERFIKSQILLRKIGTRFSKLLPEEGGLGGLFTKKKPPTKFILEEKPSEPSAQATPIITARGKTFFENLGINPNSKNSKNLKKQVERTQSLFAGRVIDQGEAKNRNDKSLKDFQKTEIIKGIPANVALGAGFALLMAVPVVGQVVGVALGADLILKRKQIVEQFAEFPLETTASFAAFAVGGVATSKFMGKVTSLKALEDSGLTFVVEKPVGIKKTPLSKTFPKEIKFKINEKSVKTFAERTLKKNGVDFNKLSKIEQNFVTGQIKAFVRNNPAKLIPKARQQALKNIKRSKLKKLIRDRLEGKFDAAIDFKRIKSRKDLQKLSSSQRLSLRRFTGNLRKAEVLRIKKAVKEGREEIPIKEALGKKGMKELLERLERQIRLNPKKFISKTGKLTLRKLTKAQEKRAIGRATRKGRKKIKISEILSKSQKAELLSKIKKQIKLEPEKFIPKVRREALKKIPKKPKPLTFRIEKPLVKRFDTIKSGRQVLIQKQKQVQKQSQKLKQFEIIDPKISALQILALKKSKQSSKSKSAVKLKQAQKSTQKVIQKVEQKQKVVQKQIQKQKQKQRSKVKDTLIQIGKLKQKLKTIPRGRLRFGQLLKQKTKLNQKLKQQQKQVQKQSQKSKQLSKQVSLFKQSFNQVSQATAQIQRTRIKPKLKLKGELVQRRVPKPIIFKKAKKKVVKKKLQPSFNVFAKSRGKFVKLNTQPLSKAGAKRLGSKVVDNTLSRTFKLKPTGRKKKLGKAKGTFKAQKFRPKIRKGKKVGVKHTFIEKSRFAIDSVGEKKKLSVKRFLAQQRKPIQRKSTSGRSSPRPMPIKRRSTSRSRRPAPSQAQLKALSLGRKKRLSNLKKRR